MCGIGGIVNLTAGGSPPSRARLSAMCDAMHHRGPDDRSVDVRGDVGFAFCRLAIIDIDQGRQPMCNEDNSVRVIFNGEIYNFRFLRRKLQRAGHRFATNSDTEVIVHLWEEYGEAFTDHLEGMFAIALHDVNARRVVLVRDHIGIKPLFYALSDDHLVFGSEVKALLASGLVERSLNVDALGQFMAWEYVPGPATMLQSVRKLEPASMLCMDLHSKSVQRRTYWSLPQPGDDAQNISDTQWEDAVDAAIRQSVQQQLVADVPLGAFLSGGVDSSLVAAGMGQARTFSIGFDDPSYNELPWARTVARHLGMDHSSEIIRPNVVELFDTLMHFMDDPIGDVSVFPTYLVSQMARREITVALSGDGGDEIFGGYETYIAQGQATAWNRMPALVRAGVIEPAVRALPHSSAKKGIINKAKRFVEGMGHSESLGHARWRLFVGQAMRDVLFTPEAQLELLTPVDEHIVDLAEHARGRDARDRAMYVDLRSYLVDNCLVKVDRMSMACSLEVRVPLLDRQLVELAFSVPARLKVTRKSTKVLLKRVACRHVPPRCVHRPKEGFSIPMKHWLRVEFRPIVEDLLDLRRLRSEGIFNVATVQRLKDEHMSGRANHSHVLWSLLVFQDWRRRWAA